jgi:hypothetical protein
VLDETRPICNRCKKGGHACDGPRDAAFIAGKIVSSRRSPPKATTITTSSHKWKVTHGDVVVRPSNYHVAISAPLQGDEFELYICYSRTHLRRGAAVDAAMQNYAMSDLVAAGRNLASSPALDKVIPRPKDSRSTSDLFPLTLLSFATILFGTQHKAPPTTHTGYTLHSTALHALNTTLSHPSSHTSDAVLLSIITLAIQECLVPTSPKAYLNHMLGLARLLELRDPTDPLQTSPLSLSLYKASRHMVLFAALKKRRSCVFARREWKAALRSCVVGDEENHEQDLFDVLADCTVLQVGCDRLTTWTDEYGFEGLRNEMVRRGLGLRSQLMAWRLRSADGSKKAQAGKAPKATTMTSEIEDADRNASPDEVEAASAEASPLLMLYDTALIYVFRILSSITLVRLDVEQGSSPTATISSKDSTTSNTQIPHELSPRAREGYTAAERAAAIDVYRHISRLGAQARTSAISHMAVTTAWATLQRDTDVDGGAMMENLRARGREVTATGLFDGEAEA